MTLAAAADAVLAATWIGLAVDNLRVARHEPAAPAESATPRAARWSVLGFLLVGGAVLELRSGGRFAFHPAAALAGTALAVAGLALHARARRTLGSSWSSAVVAPPGREVVTRGPYAVVRHPLYLGVLLMAAGTVLAHTSAATVCAALGLAAGTALKIRAEERVLRGACGADWTHYAAEVPALVPRPSRLIRAWR